MKKILPFLLLIFSVILYGCAASGSSSERNSSRSGSEIIVDNPNVGLDEYVGRLSGVRVRGNGAYATVNVRGAASSTIMNDPRPLFIVDGVRVGRDFSRIYGMISIQNVNSLRVIHSSRATILYGHDGSNGVIEINTNEQ